MEYDGFIKNLKDLIGIDLANYKRPQMERRIRNLMWFEGYSDFAEYLRVLRHDSSKLEKLVDHLTINFSEFFRDPAQWEILRNEVIPLLYRSNRRLKIWSAGCAAGEEAYTLAMILADLGLDKAALVATDVDANALEKAHRGVYTDKSVHNVPDVMLKKCFNVVGGSYQVKDWLKKMVSFEKHDLLKDPPPDEDFDLVVCRNVVIYFTDGAKSVFYPNVIGALRAGGYLFAGNTEQIFQPERFGLASAGGQFFYKKVMSNEK